MQKMKMIRVFSILSLIIFLISCAEYRINTKQIFVKELIPFETLVLSIKSDVFRDVPMEIDLGVQVIEKIKSFNLFKNLRIDDIPGREEGTLFVKVVINKIDKVSDEERFIAGVFAGRALIETDVLFINAKTGDALGSFTVIGKSGGTGLSGGTGEAIRKTAEGIVDLIKEYCERNIRK